MTIFRPCISIISFIDQSLLLCNQRGRPTHLHWNSHLCHFLQQINFFLGLVRMNRILRKKAWNFFLQGMTKKIQAVRLSACHLQPPCCLVCKHCPVSWSKKITKVCITWTSLVSAMTSVTQELVKWVRFCRCCLFVFGKFKGWWINGRYHNILNKYKTVRYWLCEL